MNMTSLSLKFSVMLRWLRFPTRTTVKFSVATCVLLLSASCVPTLKQNPPRAPNKSIAASFSGSQTTNATFSEAENTAQKTWAEFFPDPDLQELIRAAIKNNQELNIRLQEMV